MKKTIGIIVAAIIILAIGAGFWKWESTKKENSAQLIAPAAKAPSENKNLNNPSGQSANIIYLVSKEDKIKFCNGATMDSEGYRKTITTEVVSDVPEAGLDQTALVKEVAILATDGMCQDVLKQTDFQVTDGIVKIAAIEGWAGISIAMCTCKPQVEVNLLRLPGIKQVIWSSN